MKEVVVKMIGVRYAEEGDIELVHRPKGWEPPYSGMTADVGYLIRAYNEGGYNCTEVSLEDLLDWLREHKPELLCEDCRKGVKHVHEAEIGVEFGGEQVG
jgi:hypothetical protein